MTYDWRQYASEQYVYVMQSGNQCKIGFSMWPRSRAIELTQQLNRPIEVKYTVECARSRKEARRLERAAHLRLEQHRVTPRGEWFNVTPNQAIKAIRLARADLAAAKSPNRETQKRYAAYLKRHGWAVTPPLSFRQETKEPKGKKR